MDVMEETMDKALTVQDERSFGLMDYAGALTQASENIRAIRKYVEDNFSEGVDFGPPFPGSDKPTLLLPGAQKFNLLFNARPEYTLLNKVEDYDKGFCLYHFHLLSFSHLFGGFYKHHSLPDRKCK